MRNCVLGKAQALPVGALLPTWGLYWHDGRSWRVMYFTTETAARKAFAAFRRVWWKYQRMHVHPLAKGGV